MGSAAAGPTEDQLTFSDGQRIEREAGWIRPELSVVSRAEIRTQFRSLSQIHA